MIETLVILYEAAKSLCYYIMAMATATVSYINLLKMERHFEVSENVTAQN